MANIYLDTLTEEAEIIFNPGWNDGLVEVYPGPDGGSGRQFLKGRRRGETRWFSLSRALQYSVVNISVVPHESSFEVVVVAVSVNSLQ